MFSIYRFLITILYFGGFFAAVDSANNGRFPMAYRGTKGWLILESTNNELSLSFDFLILNTNATEIDWAILETPLIYGDESCDDLLKRKSLSSAASNSTSGTLKLTNRNPGGGWRNSIILKGVSAATLQARSVLVTHLVAKQRQALACVNILSDDVLVFESRFYGPQIAGGIYLFLDANSKMLKVYNRLTNGNNLDAAVNWTLKNKWWIPDFDTREPSWQSCRESGDQADLRYAPPSQLAPLQPDNLQLLEIADWNSGQSSAKDDLEASVLVLTRRQQESWERYNVFGCGRIRHSDGWSANALVDNVDSKPNANNNKSQQLVTFGQDSLFHPMLVRFKRTASSRQQTTVRKPVDVKDSNNANSSFSNSSSSKKNVDGQISSPSFSLHQRTTSSNKDDKDADCRLRLGERLNLLSLDNSLPVESDQANDDDSTFAAYFTDSSLESLFNNVLMKTILVKDGSRNVCATIRPNRERTIFVQSSFYYPFAGKVTFAQPKRRPEATTVIAGDMHHLFDDKPNPNVAWSVVNRAVEPNLEDMSCGKDRAEFDPSSMGIQLCPKSKVTCSIGDFSDQLGHFTMDGYDDANTNGTSAFFSFYSRQVPLGGPYSIVGETLKIEASWAKGCANISYPASTSDDGNSCTNHAEANDRSQAQYRGALATFVGSGGINGSLFLYQLVRPENEALSTSATTFCNNLQLSNDLKMPNLIFELLDIHSANETTGKRLAKPGRLDDVQDSCTNNTITVYNPFFVNMSKKAYPSVCSRNTDLCAFGDLTQKIQSIPTQQCRCFNFMPVASSFGVTSKVLRVKRADTKQIVACATFASWDVDAAEIYVKEGVTKQQVIAAVADEFHLDNQRVEVASSSAASKYKGCVSYGITVFDPQSASIVSTISKYVAKKDNAFAKKLGSDKCVSAATTIRLSLLSLSVGFTFIFSRSRWLLRI